MKKHPMVNAAMAATVAAAGLARPPEVRAGDSEWATAGKILAGVVGAAVIGEVLRPRPQPAVIIAEPAVRAIPVGLPCEVIHIARERPRREYRRPVRYEWRETRVWEPGRWEVEVRQLRRGCRWVEVREEVWVPGRWVTGRERVRVAGGSICD